MAEVLSLAAGPDASQAPTLAPAHLVRAVRKLCWSAMEEALPPSEREEVRDASRPAARRKPAG